MEQLPEVVDQPIVKVLLVDDILENLLALEALLKQPGLQVLTVTSATQALELLLDHDFAVALIDVQMPEINGFELAEMMRSTERTRHIPIVFVTAGSVEPSYAFKGYESGAIDFLYKPLDNHTVKSKVNIFIEIYRQRLAVNQQVVALRQAHQEQQRLLDQLQQTQTDLQKAMRLRDEFMSVVSHELRTPLNTLKLELYTRRLHLENGDDDAFTFEKIENMVASDERQLNRLIRLINDMTDVARIRTGQLSMRPATTDLVTLTKRVADQFAAQVEMAGSALHLQNTGAVINAYIDEFRIEQAVINLLTNAIRYSAHKPIEISVDEVGDKVRIGIRDYGKGIPDDDQRRIFQQFERGSNERKGSGLGLGLFIAHQIVTAHGGTLAVASKLDEGSLFTLELPKKYAFDLDDE
ncbi:MAG: histidine kinase [Verrucomicrobiaceae bacterium]|nr:histidine kinase [Verrucomicrobiaceae bacterium]